MRRQPAAARRLPSRYLRFRKGADRSNKTPDRTGTPAQAEGRSTLQSPSGTGSTCCSLLGRPLLDFGPEPQFGAPTAKVDDRTGHGGVPLLVDANGVAVDEAQDLCHLVRVYQLFGGDVR